MQKEMALSQKVLILEKFLLHLKLKVKNVRELQLNLKPYSQIYIPRVFGKKTILAGNSN